MHPYLNSFWRALSIAIIAVVTLLAIGSLLDRPPQAAERDNTTPVQIDIANDVLTLKAANGELVGIPLGSVQRETTAQGQVVWRATVAHTPSTTVVDVAVLKSQCAANEGIALVLERGTSTVIGRFPYKDSTNADDVPLTASVAIAICALGEARERGVKPSA